MPYTYDQILAVDPNNTSTVAANAAITIFNPSDPGKAPIAITDVNGTALPNPITVNRNGFGPAFQHPTLDRVGWHGGGFTGYFTSYEGMKAEAVDARTAAQTAAANAGSAATADIAARIAAGQFKGADGAKGADGSNVLPTQQAISEAIVNDGPAKTALNSYIQPVASQAGSAAAVNALATDATVKNAATTAVNSAAQGLGYVTSTTGKNIYDSSADALGGYYRQTDGAWTVLAGYRGSDFIRVTAGQPYTISHARFIVFYDNAKAFVSGLQQTQGIYTWTPATDGYARFSYSYTGSGPTLSPVVQMEKGSSATAPESFKRLLNGYELGGISPDPLTVTLSGTTLTIASNLGASPITLNTTLAGGGNSVFNFVSTILATTNVHSAADDIAPIRTQMGTVGANHGFATMAAWGPIDHDKTTADLGSVWTDGTREYALLAIDSSGRAIFGGSYSEANGVVTMPTITLTSNLTHVSGSTHVAPLDYTKKLGVGVAQLFPAIGKLRQKLILDGATLPEGTTKGRELEVRESYEVLDYKSLYDTAKANVGVSYTARNVAGSVRVESVHRFREGGVATVDVSLTEVKPTTLAACGFVQSVALNGTVTRYLPGVKTKGGFDWSAGVPLAGYAVSQLITTTDLHVATAPPVLSLDVRTDVGFALGVKPWAAGVTSSTARLAEAPTNLWDMRNTKKSYPTGVLSESPGWVRYEAHAYRAYLTPTQAAAVSAAGTDANAAYAALETVTALA